MRRVFLFDIDGTLITSPHGVGRRAFERACVTACGIERALASVTLHGNTDPVILDEAFRDRRGRAPTETERDAVFAHYLAALAEEVARAGAVHVLPAVESTLDALAARGDLLGLATGNLEAGARLKLECVDLWRRFRFGGFGSDASDRGELVRVAVARARLIEEVGHDRTWVVGDTPRDVAAAHAAGVRAIAVATGAHGKEALAAAGADHVLATLDELMPLVERL